MKHFDLFSGYGGFTLALEKVYGDNNLRPNELVNSQRPRELHDSKDELQQRECLDYSTIGFSEIDKYASAVLKYHWPNIKNYGDITKIDWAEVPDFNILTGGSPCQDLSIAGKRAGLEGARSGLFFEYMRAVREKRPKYFIWENVKGALSSNNGWDFATVLNEMAETGYSLWWQVLNAKDFGVPQNRERIFVIGFRNQSAPEVFFEPRTTTNNYIKVAGNLNSETWLKRNESTRRVHNPDGIAPTTPTGTGGGVMTKIIVKEATKQGYAIAEEGDSINLSVPNSKTRRGRVGKGIAQTLDTGMQQHTLQDCRIRRLTPTECERLMGLPDGWTSRGVFVDKQKRFDEEYEIDWYDYSDPISDSQRYKLCGNGVVVNVVEELIKNIIL